MFSFGAILAVSVYGLAADDVLIFGIVANVTAALGALVLGRVEDRVGPKRIIMISLVGLITTAVILLFVSGHHMFWIFGLLLTPLGRARPRPARARSWPRWRPEGREGEMFGLYATTGRAASFLAPGLFALFSGLFSDRIGIVGIALVLGMGAVAMIGVSSPPRRSAKVSEYVL